MRREANASREARKRVEVSNGAGLRGVRDIRKLDESEAAAQSPGLGGQLDGWDPPGTGWARKSRGGGTKRFQGGQIKVPGEHSGAGNVHI